MQESARTNATLSHRGVHSAHGDETARELTVDATHMTEKKENKIQEKEKQKDPLDTLLTINLLFKGGKDKIDSNEGMAN